MQIINDIGKNKILLRIIVLFFSLLIVIYLYPCVSTLAKQDKCLSNYLSNNLLYIITGIIMALFITILIKEKKLKELIYYIVEFIILVFGVYAAILIKNIIDRPNPFLEFFIISILILIFIILAILIDIRKLSGTKY